MLATPNTASHEAEPPPPSSAVATETKPGNIFGVLPCLCLRSFKVAVVSVSLQPSAPENMSGCDSYVTAWGFKKGPKSAESSQRCFAVIMPVTGNIASSQGQKPLLPCDMLGNGLALPLLRLIISPWEALLPYGKVKILLSSAAGAT